ncbi:MAG: hypothetical protein A3J65_03380 [Candidatus Buchananbacteria bacterium RIFCSPHIGHO2_02_FULL_45_11b]|uniref:Squalene cyclase C-terminal domain-containing protein n=3 Tax=Candidatus Buchananiibacteriota TaxID=1817903 RepID=A0A1G1Y6J8_9BACT|nr:MAG: hypothetical protein A2663_00495 [Candidatus Buchananbacteria bacterium RIFCSPHIGHO2_01_FULL_46_12]OGY52001.1 MAG: hypothetical protein A3J65_03380 [Candidatus Buchananbacteria bacterium RIFCSPHIGHO2_02_FULL_45_11b]OGY52849.1 MAG: hypothetical protein A3B15_00985 [Candidatus Buchananbacteria bacterium RIFCSPLOWO2_01_FULL_45_31]
MKKLNRRGFLAAAGAGLLASKTAKAQELRARIWAALNYLSLPGNFSPWCFGAFQVNGVSSSPPWSEVPLFEVSNWARAILAALAKGLDPANLSGRNLVSELMALLASPSLPQNAYAWGIVALRAAGMPVNHPTLIDCRDRLLGNQDENLGWGADPALPNSNDTAAALIALADLGLTTDALAIQNGAVALYSYQTPGGGFALAPDLEADACSDAWAIAALNRLGLGLNGDAISHLISLQALDGSFNFQADQDGQSTFRATTTAYALVALAEQAWPTQTGANPPSDPESPGLPLRLGAVLAGAGAISGLAVWRLNRFNRD